MVYMFCTVCGVCTWGVLCVVEHVYTMFVCDVCGI